MTNDDNTIPPLKAGISYDASDNNGSTLGRIFDSIGRGITKVAKTGWTVAKVIGEHADELFPYSYDSSTDIPINNLPSNAFRSNENILKLMQLTKHQTIMQRLEQADLLEDNDVKQLHHLTDLVNAYSKTNQDKTASQIFKTNALKAIVGNQLYHLSKENNHITYRDQTIHEDDAPYLVKADLHHLIEKGNRMPLPQLQEWTQTKFPRLREIQLASRGGLNPNLRHIAPARAIQPITQSLQSSKEILLGGEQALGPKSFDPPLKIEGPWTLEKALNHWFIGQGQDVTVSFHTLNFSKGVFRPESLFYQQRQQLLQQAKKEGRVIIKELDLKDQEFDFLDLNTPEGQVYGNIKVTIQGQLTVDPHGKWQFDGSISPGLSQKAYKDKPLYGDVYNFDPSTHRSPLAEALTRTANQFPGTSYGIHFTREWEFLQLKS